MQKWIVKMKSTRKTGYGALGLQKSTMAKKSTVKVNSQSKSTVKVNAGQRSSQRLGER